VLVVATHVDDDGQGQGYHREREEGSDASFRARRGATSEEGDLTISSFSHIFISAACPERARRAPHSHDGGEERAGHRHGHRRHAEGRPVKM